MAQCLIKHRDNFTLLLDGGGQLHASVALPPGEAVAKKKISNHCPCRESNPGRPENSHYFKVEYLLRIHWLIALANLYTSTGDNIFKGCFKTYYGRADHPLM